MATFREQLGPYEIRNVEGLADRMRKIEGVGSYGTVYKISVDGVPRIAKQLHNALISSDISSEERDSMLEKFFRECLLLSELDHPNIVDFIGVHSVVGSPILEVSLIMELMDTDLDRFINPKNHPLIPISIKNSILLDVSNGLLYLHSRKPESIVHRDLTTGNILLTKDLRAKIADLGVAKLLDTKAGAHTKCPGTPAYMPPEALRQNPQYGTELDIFSFGQVALCVAIQKFAEVFDVSDCCPELLADCRRRNQIHILKRKVWIDSLESPNSCLRELILGCLKDSPNERPTAKIVSEIMKGLCHKCPKSPADFSTVWKGPGMEAQSQKDVDAIANLREELEHLSSENLALKSDICSLQEDIEAHKVVDTTVRYSCALLTKELSEKEYENEMLGEEHADLKKLNERRTLNLRTLCDKLEEAIKERDDYKQKVEKERTKMKLNSPSLRQKLKKLAISSPKRKKRDKTVGRNSGNWSPRSKKKEHPKRNSLFHTSLPAFDVNYYNTTSSKEAFLKSQESSYEELSFERSINDSECVFSDTSLTDDDAALYASKLQKQDHVTDHPDHVTNHPDHVPEKP